MPIGTSATVTLLRTNKPKVTRLPKAQEKSFLRVLLESTLVAVAGTVLAPFTGGLSESIALSLGATDLFASLFSFSVGAITEGLVQEIYDRINEQNTTESTLLNFGIPAIARLGDVTRASRITKALQLANKTRILEKVGVGQVNNLEEIVQQLTGKRIITTTINNKKQLFNFGIATKESVLQNLGFIVQEDFKTNFRQFTSEQLKDSLLLQASLTKISKKIMPILKIKDVDAVNIFLAKYGTDLESVLKFNELEWLTLVNTLQKTNSGKMLVLTLQQIRASTLNFNYKNKWISKSLTKVSSSFKYFNFNYYLNAGLNKFWEETSYFARLKERIIVIQEKITALEEKVWSKIENLKAKGRQALGLAEKEIATKYKLIPLVSPVFSLCKIEPLNLEECVITIFHKDERYDPIVVIDTILKAETFVVQEHPFGWYRWQSGWYVGYGVKKNKLFTIINYAPGIIKQASQEALRVKFQYDHLKDKYEYLRDRNSEGNLFKSLTSSFKWKSIHNSLLNAPLQFSENNILTNKSIRPIVSFITLEANSLIKNSKAKPKKRQSKSSIFKNGVKQTVATNGPQAFANWLESELFKRW